jgi:hypothetical protein
MQLRSSAAPAASRQACGGPPVERDLLGGKNQQTLTETPHAGHQAAAAEPEPWAAMLKRLAGASAAGPGLRRPA